MVRGGLGETAGSGRFEHEEVPHGARLPQFSSHISWEARTVLIPLHRPGLRDGRDLARVGRIK